MPPFVRCTAAGIVLIAALAACDSSKKAAPAPSATGSASAASSATAPASGASGSGALGSATAQLTLGTQTRSFGVTCARSNTLTQATGNDGTSALTLTVAGAAKSAVVVSKGSDGSTTIYQAIAGLRDDTGKAVGSLTVTAASDTLTGKGTFVLTKIDKAGARVRLSAAASSSSGSFRLTCGGGYRTPATTGSSTAHSTAHPSANSTAGSSAS